MGTGSFLGELGGDEIDDKIVVVINILILFQYFVTFEPTCFV